MQVSHYQCMSQQKHVHLQKHLPTYNIFTTFAYEIKINTAFMLCAWREDDCLYTTNHPDYDTLGCIYNHELTSVEDIHTSPSYQKLLRDGQLLIIHEGKTYNVMGVAIE